jgi:TrmH family RNA methyltransferase
MGRRNLNMQFGVAPGRDYNCRVSGHVAFVLVRPQRAANVGASCRALKNMGFFDLRLVASSVDRRDEATRNPAWRAWDVLDAAREYDTLPDALADCTAVVACSGRAGDTSWTPRELADNVHGLAGAGRLAVVFGSEAAGLTNAELLLCPRHVRIPSAPEQPSLNLAQAVLVVAYELSLAASPTPSGEAGAAVGDVETALAELRAGLLGIGYLHPQNPDAILGEIRSLLARAQPTPREVALLRGLARQLRWAAAHIASGREAQG